MTESTPADVELGAAKRRRKLDGSDAILTIAVGVSPKLFGELPRHIGSI